MERVKSYNWIESLYLFYVVIKYVQLDTMFAGFMVLFILKCIMSYVFSAHKSNENELYTFI